MRNPWQLKINALCPTISPFVFKRHFLNFGLLICFVFIISSCQAEQPYHSVIYKVKSTSGSAAVAYTKANGDKSEMVQVSTPWMKRLSFSDTIVYLLVANPNDSGDISCEIILDGKSLKFEEAIYPNDKVACALFIP